MCVHRPAEAQQSLMCYSVILHFIPLRQGLSLNLELFTIHSHLGWLASKPQCSFYPPVLGLQKQVARCGFYVMAEILIQVLIIISKHSYPPSHLPSYQRHLLVRFFTQAWQITDSECVSFSHLHRVGYLGFSWAALGKKTSSHGCALTSHISDCTPESAATDCCSLSCLVHKMGS